MSRRRVRLAPALAAILVLALAARLWGIRYGLPWLFYFHDEPQIVLRALRMGTGDLNPHFFIWPGTLLMYLALAAYAGLFVVGRLAGWWAGKAGFAAAYFADPTAFYLLPRLESVAFGTWGVWLANGLGEAAYGAPVGIAAALGLAASALAAHYAHLAHPVTAMTAFTLLGLWAAVRLANDGGRRELALGALALGCGTAVQYHAGLLAAPLGVAVLIRAVREPRAAGAWVARGLAMGAAGVAIFLVLVPYVALDFATFRADLAWITAKESGALPAASSAGGGLGLFGFVRVCVWPALGTPLALAAGAGTLLALVRRTRADFVLLSFVAAYLALASRAANVNDRYAIPLVVPAVLFVARLVLVLVNAVPAIGRARAWLPATAVALLCAPLVLQLLESDLTMTRVDTRVEALHWFERHVPADSRVVLDMMQFWNSATAPLSENRARIEERMAEIGRGVSGAGHSAVYLEYYRFRLAHPVQPAYYLAGTRNGSEAKSLAAYRAEGYEYAMTSGDVVDGLAARPAPPDSSGPAFYRALERECDRLATFSARRWRTRGPEIRIYRIAAPARAAGRDSLPAASR